MVKFVKMSFGTRLMMILSKICQIWALLVVSCALFIILFNEGIFHTFIKYIHSTIQDYKTIPLAVTILAIIWVVHPILKTILRWTDSIMITIQSCCSGRAIIAIHENGSKSPIIYDGKTHIEIFDAFMEAALAGEVLTNEEFAKRYSKSS